MTGVGGQFTAIDCAVDTTRHLEALKRAGVERVFRYLNPLGKSSKEVTEAEARAIAAAGLQLGLVSEGWGDFAHGALSAAAGTRDGEGAARKLPLLGAGNAATVYFAVDTDASELEVSKLVLPYFAEVARVASGKYRVGVYGSGLVCSRVLASGFVELAWLACSTGWRESREFAKSAAWAIKQEVPREVKGFSFDPDDTRGDCGSFVPFASAAPAPATSAPSELERFANGLASALFSGTREVASVAVPIASTLESAVLEGLKKL
jgi:Rv2525c-like, glycoside hydrolase-like domain